jgi:pilus assembly protein TadC
MIFFLNLMCFLSVAWLTHHLFQRQFRWNPEPVNLQPVISTLSNVSPVGYKNYLKRKLITARWKLSPGQFLLLQLFSGITLATVGIPLMLMVQKGWPSVQLLMSNLMIFSLLGILLPWLKLISDVQNRQKHMIKDLSTYLDLMTLGVEAGLDYFNVLSKVMVHSKPGALKEELELLVSQMQMGKSRSESWKEFSDRIDLPEINSLILALIQTDQTGAPLAATLRSLSVDIKSMRFQQAEKRAYQMPVKMLVPLLGCIFPAVFILIFEPLILRFLRLL